MRIIILILCCVCGSYGANTTERPKSGYIVTFNVSVLRSEKARCRSSQQELTLEEGSTVILNASASIPIPNKTRDHIEIIKCTYNNGTENYELGEEYNRIERNGQDWRQEQIVKKHMFGTWTCKIQYNKDCHSGEIKPIEENRSFSYVLCNIAVKKPDVFAPTTTPIPPKMPVDKDTWYTIAGVGTLVMLVIIGQAIALCYFRRKAQLRRRMDDMTTRSRFDRGDRARYSAPPCKKGKPSARAEADRDSHIYEMVGINTLYNKSSDLAPEANTATAERTIRDRPPLPLPHEIPKPVLSSANETLPRHKPAPMTSMPSTLSLSSASSGNLTNKKKGKELPPPPGQGFKKAPARPPKQVGEHSIPGSLPRPAMPLPAPAPAAAPAPALIKTLPETPSTESSMSELKNIFKKRNAGGKDKSKSPPAATLERKEPPKVQAKPKLTKSPKKQPPDAITIPVPHHTPAAKPINQTNQIKLILPKIEATLKAPKPLKPKPDPTTSPIKSPPTPMKKPSHVTQKPMPLPVTQPRIPVQKRPLPTPETSRKLPPEPISPKPVPLTPLYQASHEGSPNTDDDEEWTYEQLGQYNIYNI